MTEKQLKTLKDLEYKYKNVMSEMVNSGKVNIDELKVEVIKIKDSCFKKRVSDSEETFDLQLFGLKMLKFFELEELKLK